jgi:hypothetical protein
MNGCSQAADDTGFITKRQRHPNLTGRLPTLESQAFPA